MVLRSKKKKRLRNWAEKQYAQHLRHNIHFATPGKHDFAIVLDNLKPTFNIGKIFRSADAFGARQVHLIGTDYFQTTSAKGAFKYVPAVFHDSFAQCYEQLISEGYSLYVLAPEAGSTLLEVTVERKCAFIFGNEETGVSFDHRDFPGIKTVNIPQYGRVESLNVSIAASIAMYEYIRQHDCR